MKKLILVTGAAGFIGKAVVSKLLGRGYQVLAMLRPGTIPPFTPHENLSVLYADIVDYDSYAQKVRKVDAIVHLAANKYHPKLSYFVNLNGAKNIVRLCVEGKFKSKRVINISSQSTKIRFRGVYGESKKQSDEIIQQADIEWTTLKPSLVYGNGEETLFQTIRKYTEKLPFVPVIGNGKWELYPIDVEDLAEVIIKSLENKNSIHKTYDLGALRKIKFDELVLMIQKEIGISKPIIHIPALFGLIAVYCATKIIPKLPISVDNVLGSTQNTDCNPLPAIKDFRLELLPTNMGIKKYLGKTFGQSKMIIMVGLGKMGIMHLSVLQTIKEAQVVAIVDQDKTLGQTALSMGVKAKFYSSLTEAINNHQADAVFICTPTFAHKEIINICLKSNIPFFVEKPVYVTHRDFEGKYPDSVAGYFWIYKREVEYTKTLIQNKVIGDITNYQIFLKHSEVFGPKKGWLFKKSLSGGGVLANPGPHAFSLINYLFGKGKVVNAKLDYLYGNEVEDKAIVSLEHKGKIKGMIDANWSIKGYPVMKIEFKIIGTHGIIEYKNSNLKLIVNSKVKNIPYYMIPSNHKVFNLNPKSGGESYYTEDELFIKSLSDKNIKCVNNLQFANEVEAMISEAYATNIL